MVEQMVEALTQLQWLGQALHVKVSFTRLPQPFKGGTANVFH